MYLVLLLVIFLGLVYWYKISQEVSSIPKGFTNYSASQTSFEEKSVNITLKKTLWSNDFVFIGNDFIPFEVHFPSPELNLSMRGDFFSVFTYKKDDKSLPHETIQLFVSTNPIPYSNIEEAKLMLKNIAGTSSEYELISENTDGKTYLDSKSKNMFLLL